MLIKQVFGTEILSEIYCSSVSSNSSNSSFLRLGLIGTKMIVILLQIKPKEFSIRVFRTNGSQFILLRFLYVFQVYSECKYHNIHLILF